MKRALLAAAAAIAAAALLAVGTLLFLIRRNLPDLSSGRIPGLSSRVSVAFDDRGVATVTAATVRDALRAQGWLTARERFFQLELQRRLALPMAPMLFALVGVPLGLRRSRGARSWGALLCIAVVFGYYALLSLSQFLGGGGVLSPAIALWLPNAAFGALAAFLLYRARYRSV